MTFGYRPGEPVLRDMSFTVAPHSVAAFVGASGGGKSTIFNVLLGLYQVQSGTVRIDGQDIATVSPRSLRRQIAYVGQDVFLFHGTIREHRARPSRRDRGGHYRRRARRACAPFYRHFPGRI